MVEIGLGLGWVLLGVISVLFGGVIGLRWVKGRTESIEQTTMKNRVGLMKDYADELKKDLQRTRGKLSQFNTMPKLDVNLEEGDLEQLIPKLLGEYSGMAPKWARPLLSDPNISAFLVKQAKEHPEEAKSFIKQFIGSKITDGSKTTDESEELVKIQSEQGA